MRRVARPGLGMAHVALRRAQRFELCLERSLVLDPLVVRAHRQQHVVHHLPRRQDV